MEKDAAEAELARKKQHVENLNFVDYLTRAKSDKKEIQTEKIVLSQVSLINEEVEANAEVKRQEKKKQLNAELRVCIIFDLFDKTTNYTHHFLKIFIYEF